MIENTTPSKPALYIIVRDDMDSMSLSRGRSGAQISHATSSFHNFINRIKADGYNLVTLDLYNKWADSPDGIGVVIVIRVDNGDALVELYRKMAGMGIPSGLYEDTSYAVRDGMFTHYVSVQTTGWVFIDRSTENADVLMEYKLY